MPNVFSDMNVFTPKRELSILATSLTILYYNQIHGYKFQRRKN